MSRTRPTMPHAAPILAALLALLPLGAAHAQAPAESRAEELPAPLGPDRYLVERVEIRGARRTRPERIRRQITVRPGELLDEAQVRRSRRQVNALGLFRAVDVHLERGVEPGRVVVVFAVVERPSLVISDLTLGFTDASRLFGGFGLTDTNVLGTGLVAGGAFVVGDGERRGWRAQVLDPDFLGRDLAAGLTGVWLEGVEVDCPDGLGDCDRSDYRRLAYRRAGGVLSLGLRPGRTDRVWLHARGEAVRATPDEDVSLGAPGGLPWIEAGSSVLTTVTVVYQHDTRDDAFLATRGTEVSASLTLGTALFGSDYDYTRTSLLVARTLPTGGGRSLRLRLTAGLVQGQAPFFERFFPADHRHFTLGGSTLPRALELSFSEVGHYDDVLLSGGASWRIPLFSGGGFAYRGYLYSGLELTFTAATVDAPLFDTAPRDGVSRFPLSADVGVRVDTAIGVFSVGAAWALDLAW